MLLQVYLVYEKLENYPKSLDYLLKSDKIIREIKNPNLLKEVSKSLSETYEAKGDLNNALKYLKFHFELKDSLLNIESLSKTAELETLYETEKKEKENDDLREAQKLQATENKYQKWLLGGLSGLLLVGGLFGASVYNSRKKERKSNFKITKQRDEIWEQKKEIDASIRYASNIQQGLLPKDSDLENILDESFILYKPKDVVSGDFYWATEKNGKSYFSVSDCTGHGVPGAFMSAISISLLNEALKEKNHPGEIFDFVRQGIIETTGSTGELGSQKDGFDGILCSLDKQNNILEFASAKNPLYLVRDNKIEILKLDKMPVGYEDNMHPFTSKKIKLEKNDMIYLFTDGYQDQFGGPRNKKFNLKKLREMLVSINEKSLPEQKEILESKLNAWMKDEDQIDDISAMGIRI